MFRAVDVKCASIGSYEYTDLTRHFKGGVIPCNFNMHKSLQ